MQTTAYLNRVFSKMFRSQIYDFFTVLSSIQKHLKSFFPLKRERDVDFEARYHNL